MHRIWARAESAPSFEEIADEVLDLALQVANDVIPFDGHRVYLTHVEAERVWHFTRRFNFEGPDLERELGRSRRMFEQIRVRAACRQLVEHERHNLLCRIELPDHGYGYLSLSRPVHRSGTGETTAKNCFSPVEVYHLQMVAALVEQALRDKELALLRRLHLNFLDGRMLIQSGSFEEIVRQYLYKAAHLCHEMHEEDFQEGRAGPPRAVVRLTFKQVNNNRTALGIVDALSSRSGEWDGQTRKDYPLPESNSLAESFAARAYLTRQTQQTNRYADEVAAAYRVFPDTTKHISSPVVAGDREPLGVLSIETTTSEDYPPMYGPALTLLAAHAYWPLWRAWERETVSRKAEFFSDELLELRSETTEANLIQAFRARLQRLGYARGLFSRVDHRGQMIHGYLAWGDGMEAVKEITHRHFARDAGDCQVLAVADRRPVPVPDPDHDPKAKEDAKAVGHLKPFCIYPIQDSHGRVIWTIHLERRDISRHNKTDEELIATLGMRVMKAWEEERRTQFERDWFRDMFVHSSYTYLEEFLRRFANFIVEEQIVTRCRVFAVDAVAGTQRLTYQAGAPKAREINVTFLEPNHRIFFTRKPILNVLKGGESNLKDEGHFQIDRNASDPHAHALANDGRTQWVEIPVWFAGHIVAKLVLDHVGAPLDAFLLGEMRLVSRLHHLLEAGAEVLEAHKAIAKLSGQGLHLNLLLHFCRNELNNLSLRPPGADLTQGVKDTIQSLRDFDAFFRGGERHSVREILDRVNDACGYLRRSLNDAELQVDLSLEGTLPQTIRGEHELPLLLILVTLAENAAKHSPRSQPGAACHRSVTIEANCGSDPHFLVISVCGGADIEPEREALIQKMLEDPVLYVSKETAHCGKIGGLVLASLLAKLEGWALELASARGPTKFTVTVSVQGGGQP